MRSSWEALPSDAENVWFCDEDPDTVIVFVHGLYARTKRCWLHDGKKNKRTYWPELAQNDSRIGATSIFLGGYATGIGAGDYGISDCSSQLMHALESQPDTSGRSVLDRKNIFFLCHSAGGIVVRDLLVRNTATFAPKRIELALYGSPSAGSAYADLAEPVVKFIRNKLAVQLTWNDADLVKLDRAFMDLLFSRELAISGVEYCEHLGYGVGPLRLPRVVDRASAGRYFGNLTVIPRTDHNSLVKPPGKNHPSHTHLVTDYLRFKKLATESKF